MCVCTHVFVFVSVHDANSVYASRWTYLLALCKTQMISNSQISLKPLFRKLEHLLLVLGFLGFRVHPLVVHTYAYTHDNNPMCTTPAQYSTETLRELRHAVHSDSSSTVTSLSRCVV